MIDHLRELIKSHWPTFQEGGACDSSALSFTKFCQRIVQPHTKVLYFVTHQGRPLCILKTVRFSEFNENLKREKRAQEVARPVGRVRAPKVYFDGMVGERYVFAEECVEGLPVSRIEYAQSANELGAFVRALPARGSISARALSELLARFVPSGLLEQELSILSESGEELPLGLTHGDLGRPNVLSAQGSLVVIDWERAGDIPLAGVDSVTIGLERSPILNAAYSIYSTLYKKYYDAYRSLVSQARYTPDGPHR